MWHSIEEDIAASLGSSFKIISKSPVSGGDSHQAFSLETTSHKLFIKINDKQYQEHFACEADALKQIAHTQTIKTPKVICFGHTSSFAYLVLTHHEFDNGNHTSWQQAGEQLAGLHLIDNQEMFGWDRDNFIGKTTQANKWHKSWARFFAEQRIGAQLELLKESGQQFTHIKDFISIIERLLKQRKPLASLLHGDLWRGNLGFAHNKPFIFDPACYFGDYEADLAMTELFGKFPPEFYQGYYAVTSKEDGYELRKRIYNLYHILNHANLFAGEYVHTAQAEIDYLLAI
ncbi:fructosamine kinase family protein [Catenovulum sp. SM1970]|uniref:fructosamine kinase family protein n=1 Tax=Marinifaba aquimaris TaxID=2741323 RepID=UPI0015741C22|nr:fructosamine kinase family protein [Marinifaba aquimaris]NTS78234.1 fructosamine kinase family protein [Marinifaba aquimaris]